MTAANPFESGKVQPVREGYGEGVFVAISRPLQSVVEARGIRVIPFVAGDQGEVIGAWSAGKLTGGLFAMPGCCDRRMRFRGGRFGRAGFSGSGMR